MKHRSPARAAFPAVYAEGVNPGCTFTRVGRTALDYGSRDQPEFTAWLAEQKLDIGCECPDPQCAYRGEPGRNVLELHHEPCGQSKDDRSQCVLSYHCHHVLRHGKAGTCEGWAPQQYRAWCEARASRHWRRFCREVGR